MAGGRRTRIGATSSSRDVARRNDRRADARARRFVSSYVVVSDCINSGVFADASLRTELAAIGPLLHVDEATTTIADDEDDDEALPVGARRGLVWRRLVDANAASSSSTTVSIRAVRECYGGARSKGAAWRIAATLLVDVALDDCAEPPTQHATTSPLRAAWIGVLQRELTTAGLLPTAMSTVSSSSSSSSSASATSLNDDALDDASPADVELRRATSLVALVDELATSRFVAHAQSLVRFVPLVVLPCIKF